MRFVNYLAQVLAGALLAVVAFGSGAVPAFGQNAGVGSCQGNHVPDGLQLLLDPVSGGCWPALGTPGSPGVFSDNFEGTKLSYSAYFSNLVVPAAATDIATLRGSASKTVRVTHAEVSCTATTGANYPALLVTYSTLYTGGTLTALTGGVHDRNDAGTATSTNFWTASPTVGGGARVMRAGQGYASNAGVLVPVQWDFGVRNAKNVVLRGVAQYAGINLGATTLAGGLCSGGFEWTEE